MTITIEIKETERGDICFEYWSKGAKTATAKELAYTVCTKELLSESIPVIAKKLGAAGSMVVLGKPQNQ